MSRRSPGWLPAEQLDGWEALDRLALIAPERWSDPFEGLLDSLGLLDAHDPLATLNLLRGY